ncbi:uncharacterized protein EDB93DRAFT_1124539 [Suillus bovinus]|uniref:uncharacterized protein n=1 Tax=Suillus bovinus TaxID=48563 RepID=UPI001B87BD78|nr:uncharacterized protein EDB93DRAFT_1124539 [Suillus bovinus]KAG2157769.1 hypothetical protein EDB93DRAFT_1124539 [Suillus bovinus]
MVTAETPPLNSRAQTEIDNELEALEERMRALRTCRNSFSPISFIPPEILGAIFVHHVQQTQSCYPLDSRYVLLWLKVGHICHHWREVALGTPELWATPFLNSSRVTEEMLMRSKMATLNLRRGLRYRMEAVQMVLMNIERLQEVSFPFLNDGTTRCIEEFLDKVSSYSAPKLRSLLLEAGSSQTPRIAIPTSFLAPNLRSLQIKYCDISWSSSILTGLTVLSIEKLSPEYLPTLDELISALRRMPALHTLELDDALPTLPPKTMSLPCPPRVLNVRLPHLKRLRLIAKVLEVANVLACVELPDSMLEVELKCRASSSMDQDQECNLGLPIISHALESCLKAIPAESRQFLCSIRLFAFGASGGIHMQYSTARDPSSWVESLTDICLPVDPEWVAEYPVILLDLGFPSEISTAILSDLWQLVPFRSLEALCIKGLSACWDGFWADLLGRGAAHNLEKIYLQGTPEALEDLLISLRSQTYSIARSIGGRSRKRQNFAPALSHLVLERLEFHPSSSSFTKTSDLLDVLVDRINKGRGLDHLTITGCTGISAHDVRLLREVVADIDWDEYESFNDDDYDSFEDGDDDEYGFYSDVYDFAVS